MGEPPEIEELTGAPVWRPDSYAETYKTRALTMSELVNTLSIRIYDHGVVDLSDRYWNGQNTVDSHCRIFYPDCGTAWLFCNGERWELTPGCFHFFPSQMRITLPENHDTRLYLQHCRLSIWSGIDLWYVLKPRPVRLDEFPAEWVETFKRCAENQPVAVAPQLELLALTYNLVARFAAVMDLTLPEHSMAAQKRIARALRAIEQHPQQVFGVGELAKLCGMSREGFSRIFKQLVGISPARYQLERRIGHIQQLLLSGEEKLEALAAAFGFSSAYHLSNTFKRYVGVPPKEFRRHRIRI